MSILVTALPVTFDAKAFIVESWTDVTGRKVQQDDLRMLSLVDDLTQVYNRRGFMALAAQKAKRLIHSERELLLLYLDVDGLKAINHTYGHDFGDEALVDLATMLGESFRGSDVVARVGGDEFAILTTGDSVDEGDRLTAQIIRQVESWGELHSRPYGLSVDVGIACWDRKRRGSIDELLAEAERNMNAVRAKRTMPVRNAGA